MNECHSNISIYVSCSKWRQYRSIQYSSGWVTEINGILVDEMIDGAFIVSDTFHFDLIESSTSIELNKKNWNDTDNHNVHLMNLKPLIAID